MLYIISDTYSESFKYCLKTIFTDRFNIEYAIIDIADIEGKKNILSYCKNPINNNIPNIPNSGFLNTVDKLKSFTPKHEIINKVHVLFPLQNSKNFIDFDIFSATFFMLSRYEEYFNYTEDQHNRFSAKESFAYKHGFLDKPIVDIWIRMLQKKLEERFEFTIETPQIKPIASFDIDIAFSYLSKGLKRGLGGFARDLFKLNIGDAFNRILVIGGIKKDPYNTFDTIIAKCKQRNIKPLFFIQIGDYGKYDKNPSSKNKRYQNLIKKLSGVAEIGLHPSYNAYQNFEILKREKETLENIISKEVIYCRRHYLRIKTPISFLNEIKLGFSENHSMGFADNIGFRAGISSPFFFFDLSKNRATNLKIQPFAIMEGSLIDYQNNSVEQAVEEIDKIIEKTRLVSTHISFLWHNESLSAKKRWKNWDNILWDSLDKIIHQ